MSRSVGIKRDLRLNKLETYANYYYLNFRSYVGTQGDCYDRFLLRMCEMCESINISNQVVQKLTKFNQLPKNKSLKLKQQKIVNTNPHSLTKYLVKKNLDNINFTTPYNSMENLIKHFKF